jgi:hypothetical protein
MTTMQTIAAVSVAKAQTVRNQQVVGSSPIPGASFFITVLNAPLLNYSGLSIEAIYL